MTDRTPEELLAIPQELADLADDIRDFRLNNRRPLSVGDNNLLLASEARIRGLSTALAALLSEAVLDGVRGQLNELGDAIKKLQDLLNSIANLREILRGIARVIQLASDIVGLLTPIP